MFQLTNEEYFDVMRCQKDTSIGVGERRLCGINQISDIYHFHPIIEKLLDQKKMIL